MLRTRRRRAARAAQSQPRRRHTSSQLSRCRLSPCKVEQPAPHELPASRLALASYTRLALVAAGTPYVAYRDEADSSCSVVGSVGLSRGDASFTSLALGANGTRYVAYRRGRAKQQLLTVALALCQSR